MMKRSPQFALFFLLLLFPLFMSGCVLDSGEDSVVKSVTIEPNEFKLSELSGVSKSVEVKVTLDVDMATVDKAKSRPFYVDNSGSEVVATTAAPQEDGKTLTYTISYSWLSQISAAGTYNVGFKLFTSNSQVSVNDRTKGVFKVTQ